MGVHIHGVKVWYGSYRLHSTTRVCCCGLQLEQGLFAMSRRSLWGNSCCGRVAVLGCPIAPIRPALRWARTGESFRETSRSGGAPGCPVGDREPLGPRVLEIISSSSTMTDIANTMSSPEYRRLSCAQCGRSFARREHLKRHLAVHDSENAYACSTCSKRFTRSDALARHEATHLLSTNGRKQKRFRSCASCVAAKTRCSSQVPCTRCIAKKIDCHSQTHSRSHSQPAAPYENCFDGNTPPSTQMSAGNTTNLGCASPYDNVFYTPSSESTPSASGAQGPPIMSNAVITQQNAIQMQPSPIQMEPQNLQHGNEEVTPEHINHTTDITIIRAHISQSTMDLDTALTTSSASASGSSHRDMFEWGINKVPQAKELYIDSYGARLPRRRRASTKRHHNVRPPTHPHFLMSFPPSRLSSPELEDENLRNHIFMPRETWEEARISFERCCLTPSPVFPTFSSSHFPSQEDFNIMIAAYFDNFHQILPVVHLPSLSLEPDNWLLALSLAALGAHFVNSASMFDLVNAMHEFLQRALVLAVSAPVTTFDPSSALLLLISIG